VTDIEHFVVANRLRLSREMKPQRLLEQESAWSETQEKNLIPPSLRRQFPSAPLPMDIDSEDRRMFVQKLETFNDLKEEGARMKHCVYSMAQVLTPKKSAFIHSTIDGVSSTLMLQKKPGEKTYALREARKKCNADLSGEELAIVQSWLQTINDRVCEDGVIG